MRTTVDLSDELFRRAKAAAALRGRKLKDLVEEGLRLVLDGAPGSPPAGGNRPTLYDVMKDACGIVDSGVEDLGSNPKHLEGLGRDSLGHR
jgi:hypothetical protein